MARRRPRPAVAHYAGNAWTFAQLTGAGTPIAIAAVGGQDAWIVQTTSPRSLQHYTGGGWTAVTDVPAADYRDIWAASATGVFVATSDLGVLEWTGSTWQTVGALGVGAERIDGTDASDVWVVTAAGDLQRWDGAAWTPVAIDMVVSNIDVVGTSNVWAIGASASTPNNAAIGHWDGTQWTITLEPALDPTFGQNFKAVTATAANDAWVAEPSAHSRHFDGFNWSPAGLVATSGASGGIMAMKSFPGTAMQITFDGYFYRYRGQMYARFATDAAATLRSSASTSPTVTVAIDINNVHMFDGTTWSQPTLDARNKFVLWAAGPGDIWVGGTSGLLYRFDGTGWNDTAWGGTLTIRAIAGSSSTDVWLFGTTVYHYDGVTYTQSLTLVPAAQITNASSSGPNDVWAISGGTGTDIHHWDGGTWTTTHIDDALVDIVALAPDNAFAVGGSRIFHWDGSTWTSSMFPVTSNFVDIAATGPSDVFAVTSTDMFHFDGARWASVRPPVDLEIDMRSIMHVDPHRGYIDLVYNQTIGYVPMRRLIRTRLWNCSASETNCSDGVDDDCDNVVDNLDSDCP